MAITGKHNSILKILDEERGINEKVKNNNNLGNF